MSNPPSKMAISNKKYLNNYIDKPFRDMLYPLNIALSLLQIPKYNIIDGFISPNSLQQILKTLLTNILLMIVLYYRFRMSNVVVFSKAGNFITTSLYIDMLYYSTGLSTICLSGIIQAKHNVCLILSLQKALRTFRYPAKSFKRLMYGNLISFAIVPVCYLLFVMFMYNGNLLSVVLNFLPVLYFDATVIYLIRVLCVMKDGMNLWIKELRGRVLCRRVPGRQNMLEGYRLWLDAFGLFKKISWVPIAFLLFDIICHTIMYIQVNMDLKKQSPNASTIEFMTSPARVSVILWRCKHYLLLCIFCYTLDAFYSQVGRAVEVTSAAVLHSPATPARRLCKNIRRCAAARARQIRVCGAPVDARLPPAVAVALTTYIAVVLQFNW